MTRRLLLGLLAFATLVLLVLVLPLGVANQRSERADLTRRLERDAVAASSIAVDLLAPATTAPQRERLRQRLETYAADTDARVVVVDAHGESVLDTGEADRDVELGRDFSTRPEVAAALDGRVDSGERGSDTLGRSLLFVATPVARGGASMGAVRLSYPSEELDERIRAYWLALAGVAAAVLAVAALAAVLVARWIARPLDRIAHVADAVGAGELHARADEQEGPPEVRTVAARLNASVEQLERMLADQRAFAADASHQLRTPLHALTLRLENVQHALRAGDVADAAADVDVASAEVERLASLVEALLVLERADRSDAPPPEPTDLAAVAQRRHVDWSERAARRDVTVQVDVPEPLVALAHGVHVEQVLDNLVDNAIAVSPVGRVVRIVGRLDRAHAELHVVDEGPGMDDDDLEHAFRRFRTGADRPARPGAGGFGLGLAIVRRLVEVDGGTAELRHGPGRGVDAVVCYPLADSEVLNSGARSADSTS